MGWKKEVSRRSHATHACLSSCRLPSRRDSPPPRYRARSRTCQSECQLLAFVHAVRGIGDDAFRHELLGIRTGIHAQGWRTRAQLPHPEDTRASPGTAAGRDPMTPGLGSVRREGRIARPAGEVWELVGDPARVHEWFPGIVSCTVEGDQRLVTTAGGLPVPERLVTVDPIQRRLQYRITAPMVGEHLSTLDVHDLYDGTSLVVYSAQAEPAALALVIGGAGGNAIENLRTMMEKTT